MRQLEFHEGYIRSLMSDKDVRVYQLTRNTTIEERILQATETLSNPTYRIGTPNLRKTNSGLLSIPRSWEDKIYLSHLNHRLRNHYAIKFDDRVTVVSNLVSNLRTDVPNRILRSDLKSFFESVETSALLSKLDSDGFLRVEEFENVETILNWGEINGLGIPRGLSLSSSLAELSLKSFDQEIIEAKGTVYYRRYVDDFVIMSSSLNRALQPLVKSVLPRGMRLNPMKTREFDREGRNGVQSTVEFDFLGYGFNRRFCSRKREGGSGTASLSVDLSEKTIEKIKRRIDLAIGYFRIDRNIRDLESRLKLLTGNYKIKKSRHPVPLRVGIFYSYSELDPQCEGLRVLDQHLTKRLIHLRIWCRTMGLIFPQRKLFCLRFQRGFEQKIQHRFGRLRLEHLTRPWLYE